MREEKSLREITPDPELRAALRGLEGDPPLGSVDWERLRSSIQARAELPLARRRKRPATPRAPSRRAHLWRPLVPFAAAASIALAVWVNGGADTPDPAPVAQLSAEEVFHADLSEQEFRLVVSGRADPESLLLIALDDR